MCRRLDAGLLEVEEGYKSPDMVGRLQVLREAAVTFKAGAGTDKQLGFYQKVPLSAVVLMLAMWLSVSAAGGGYVCVCRCTAVLLA